MAERGKPPSPRKPPSQLSRSPTQKLHYKRSMAAQFTSERQFRMSAWDDFIHRLEQDMAECRRDLELLESGQLQHRERRAGGAWVETTQREIDWHKKTIGMYDGLIRKLRAEHTG